MCTCVRASSHTTWQCPVDQYVNSSVVCHAPTSDCDAVVQCTGARCSVSLLRSPCAMHSGTSPQCPPDPFRPIGSLCDDMNVCTSPDTCQGGGVCKGLGSCQCYADSDCDDGNVCSLPVCVLGKCRYNVATAGLVCRPGTGACDVAEVRHAACAHACDIVCARRALASTCSAPLTQWQPRASCVRRLSTFAIKPKWYVA
jgi:hypothetical protein